MPIKAVVFDAYGTLYDTHSVAAAAEESFPGHGELITQLWRIKQLEYSWLRSLMGRYENFADITRDALAYALRVLGLSADADVIDRLMAKYLALDLYPEAAEALAALKTCRRAILSNGSPSSLQALVRNSGLDKVFDAIISVDAVKIYKPSPRTYALIEPALGVGPADVLFVSSNPWDVCGAKAFGLNVAWIERVGSKVMSAAITASGGSSPAAMFMAIRTQMDELGFAPDYRIASLSELPGIVTTA